MSDGMRRASDVTAVSSSHCLADAFSDAQLPDDLRLSGRVGGSPREILVTGGTGFFGRYLIATLLGCPDTRLHLLVRAQNDDHATARVQELVCSIGQNLHDVLGRVHVIRGSINVPRFGLSKDDYDALSERVDLVMHGAAEVNWTWSYRRLRAVNVSGTLEALRFAFHRRSKPIGFISTIAASFVGDGPLLVNETTPMLPYLAQMPLGYAQTKCVSEALLEQAADRGLPVTVMRASLLTGDTCHGVGDVNDLIAALLEACVRKEHALDIDWLFECIPVDYAARAFVGLTLANRGRFERYQLRARRPRHWREIVLWLNLAGYPVHMEVVDSWLDRQFGNRAGMIERMFPFRRFFLGLPGMDKGQRPFEVFLRAQRKLDCGVSYARLQELGIFEPTLGAEYFDRCTSYFRRLKILPTPSPSGRRVGATVRWNDEKIEGGLKRLLAAPQLSVIDCQPQPLDSSGGFLNELVAARFGSQFGMRRLRWTIRRRPGMACEDIEMVVKTKPRDTVMQRIVRDAANFCDPRLGSLFERFPLLPGFARMQKRERAIGTLQVPLLLRHTPRCYAVWSHPGGHAWSLATEYLGELEWRSHGAGWSRLRIGRAIDVLAALHSWSVREGYHLQDARCLPDPISTTIALEMRPLWLALAEFSDNVLSPACRRPIGAFLERIIDGIERWWPILDAMPQTLVHNDVNPRNLAWYKTGCVEDLKLFDWELARHGVPQSDTVELLCHVLPQDAGVKDFRDFLERHRMRLGVINGRSIDPETWLLGAKLALYRFGIERLPLYALVHRIKPQPFIEQLAETWIRLCDLSSGAHPADYGPQCVSRATINPSRGASLMLYGNLS